MAKLTAKQRAFCDEYLIDLNATQAAIRAGYSPETADVIGSENLGKPVIQARIQQQMGERAKRTEINADRTLKELARIGFSNITDYAKLVTKPVKKQEWNPETHQYEEVEVLEQVIELVDTDQLSDAKKAAVASIRNTKHGISIVLYDKVRALELIGRHLGMFTDNIKIQQPNNPFEGLTTEELRKIIFERTMNNENTDQIKS